jgi:endonuclease III
LVLLYQAAATLIIVDSHFKRHFAFTEIASAKTPTKEIP